MNNNGAAASWTKNGMEMRFGPSVGRILIRAGNGSEINLIFKLGKRGKIVRRGFRLITFRDANVIGGVKNNSEK